MMRKPLALLLVLVFLAGCSGSRQNTCRVQYLPEPSDMVAEIGQDVEPPQKTPLQAEREEKLLKTLSLAPTPMKAPDTILRVLIWPYVDNEGRLYTAHYAFLKVDEGQWILGEYLVKPLEEGGKVKFPLHSLPKRRVDGSQP